MDRPSLDARIGHESHEDTGTGFHHNGDDQKDDANRPEPRADYRNGVRNWSRSFHFRNEVTMSVRAPSRYGFIDTVRGIAACLVMLQHSLYQSGLLGDISGENLPGFIPNYLEIGETGVVAFFLVSGFVIPLSLEKTNDFKLFWIHRSFRIYPLYISVFIISFSIQGGGNITSFGSFLAVVASHLFFIQEYAGQPNFVGGSWTLSLEVAWYLAISTAFLASMNRRTNLIVSVSVIVSAISVFFCSRGHHLPMGRLSMLICCVFGLVCYRQERGDISKRHFSWLAAILTVTIVVNLVIGFLIFPSLHPSASFVEVIDSWALAAIVFFTPFALRGLPVWGHSGFSFLGRISYSVYLWHGIILYSLSMTPLTGFPVILVTFGITIGIATLSYRFIEAPPIRFGHRLRAANPAPLKALRTS